MKRVHFKRKLPKVKVLDFQGGRCHTRYIRRSRVSHQSGSDRTVDVALSDSVHPDHPSCSSDATQLSNSATKKQKLLEGWERVRNELLMVQVEEMSPATSVCCMCDMATDAIVYCNDCGPMAYYCSPCCSRIHSVVSFHKPLKWLDSNPCTSDEFGCMTEWSEKWNGLPSEEKEYYQGKAAQSKGLVNDPSRAKKALLKEMYQLTSNLLATGVDLACIGFDDDDKVIIIGDGKVGNHIRNQPALLNEILGHERSRSTNPVPDSTTSLKELKKMA